MLSILMPVYNESERVERAIAEVLETELPVEFELVVVDDGSTDGTRELLRRGNWDGRVRLFEHPENRGKGAAVQTALAEANGEYAAIFDADLEYDPADLALLIAPRCSTGVPTRPSECARSTGTPATRSCSCWETRGSRWRATCCSTCTCTTS